MAMTQRRVEQQTQFNDAGKNLVALAISRRGEQLRMEARNVSRVRAEAEAAGIKNMLRVKVGKMVKVAQKTPHISPELLAAGLAADLKCTSDKAAAEEEEAYRVKRLAETLLEDIKREADRVAEEAAKVLKKAKAAAWNISTSGKSLEEKDQAMVAAGFVVADAAKGDKDARYYHTQCDFFWWLQGTAPGHVPEVKIPKVYTPEEIELRAVQHKENQELAKGQAARRKEQNIRKAANQLANKHAPLPRTATQTAGRKKKPDGTKKTKKAK